MPRLSFFPLICHVFCFAPIIQVLPFSAIFITNMLFFPWITILLSFLHFFIIWIYQQHRPIGLLLLLAVFIFQLLSSFCLYLYLFHFIFISVFISTFPALSAFIIIFAFQFILTFIFPSPTLISSWVIIPFSVILPFLTVILTFIAYLFREYHISYYDFWYPFMEACYHLFCLNHKDLVNFSYFTLFHFYFYNCSHSSLNHHS